MLSPGKGGAAPIYGHALGHATYERHRPEQTLLYQLVGKHYPALIEQLEFRVKVCRLMSIKSLKRISNAVASNMASFACVAMAVTSSD